MSKLVETLQSRHFLSLLIRPDVTLLGCMDRIASQQQPQRRFSVTRDVEDDGCGLNRIAGLGAVMFPLLSCDPRRRWNRTPAAPRGSLSKSLQNRCARCPLDDHHLDTERSHLFGEAPPKSLRRPIGRLSKLRGQLVRFVLLLKRAGCRDQTVIRSMAGIAALVTFTTPKRLVSIYARMW